jgi:NAD(P)-dependent dehydrogenase (short-subunit alcohol dehydrogenase family)
LSFEGRIFAMTSTGSSSVWEGYGAVSAAKAALESHVRQLAFELGPRGITANAVCAGVTDTPAVKKIPNHETMIKAALRKNPAHRLTRPEDVANALVALAQPCTYWLNGNVLCIDGGEAHSG